MTSRKRTTGAISATELMAQLKNDPDFQLREEAERAAGATAARKLSAAEQPIVADLRAAGLEVESVWDLVNTSTPYPEALPILIDHLERRCYPDSVREGLARALAVGPAAFAWERLRRLYLSAERRGEEEGLAVALTASATAENLNSLIDLVHDESRSDTRIHFLSSILRVGGERGFEVLRSLRSDPLFGKEAKALL